MSSQTVIAKAELDYTNDIGPWQKRRWKVLAAEVRNNEVTVTLPTDRPLVYYILRDRQTRPLGCDTARGTRRKMTDELTTATRSARVYTFRYVPSAFSPPFLLSRKAPCVTIRAMSSCHHCATGQRFCLRRELDVPPEKIEGGAPAGMMNRYLLRQAEKTYQRWRADYENRKTPEQIAAYQQRPRGSAEVVWRPAGANAAECADYWHGSSRGYRVEKVIFESQPKHYVTALMFLPDPRRFKPPYPGVLEPCGHWGRQSKGLHEYQSMGALLALNGMAALVFDPIDQGERLQYLGPGYPPIDSRGKATSSRASAARCWARTRPDSEIWDGMRDRLSPIAPGGRSATNRLHGQQRRRHADQ